MRNGLYGLAGLVAALFVATANAQEPYPWCAYYSGLFSATNCGFDTLEQCRAAISGIGGICQANPAYPEKEAIKHRRKIHHG